MPKYEVDIEEETVHRVTVEADSEEAAEQMAIEAHIAGKSEFMCCRERNAIAKLLPQKP